MKTSADLPLPHDLLGSEPAAPGAEAPPLASRADARALSTENHGEPRGDRSEHFANRPAGQRRCLIEGMDRHTHPQIASDLIDEKGLARITTLSRTTLQTMRREGGGPPWAKLGPHRVAYRLADVERWIEERTRRRRSESGGMSSPGRTGACGAPAAQPGRLLRYELRRAPDARDLGRGSGARRRQARSR
jgi:predicted DNA-binding transcriptional regulator AlpA